MPSQKSSPKTITENHVEVFDPDFKFMYLVPTNLVVHTPPARLNISRLVVCRNYIPGKEGSCVKEENCRFVHADVDYDKLQAQSVHVNYIWRHEDICTYKRLPPGDVLEVVSWNGAQRPDLIPSERILVTRRALSHCEPNGSPLSHCVHFYCNRMCNRGENCNFIHAIYVDPNITRDFKRAPAQPIPRFNVSNRSSRTETSDPSVGWVNHFTPNSPQYGSLHPLKRCIAPTPPQAKTPISLPIPSAMNDQCETYGTKSTTPPDVVKTTLLEGSDSCLQLSGSCAAAGKTGFAALQFSAPEGRGRQHSFSGSFAPPAQAPMAVSHPGGEVGSSSSSSSVGLRPVAKGFDGIAERSRMESSDGFTASPSASTQSANASVGQTPLQPQLSSPYIGPWGTVLSGSASRRSYRHNPYLPVHSKGVEG
ncbi:zinc finger protein family memeber [Trypanosoma theileri]|uniref:Zinc finger protein family memeber n=1 Tax=Trypanosoma theileri TaxID=67003 RepID=A0A1X0P704_9TRYP|nr:zinc finger protein family memeber [Trypanosoma theileri]ORC92727.1 zinc finger protein family memeber [Trypanosoma theileri]